MAKTHRVMLRSQAGIFSRIHATEHFLKSCEVLVQIFWRDLSNRKSLKRVVAAMVAAFRAEIHGTFPSAFLTLVVLS